MSMCLHRFDIASWMEIKKDYNRFAAHVAYKFVVDVCRVTLAFAFISYALFPNLARLTTRAATTPAYTPAYADLHRPVLCATHPELAFCGTLTSRCAPRWTCRRCQPLRMGLTSSWRRREDIARRCWSVHGVRVSAAWCGSLFKSQPVRMGVQVTAHNHVSSLR